MVTRIKYKKTILGTIESQPFLGRRQYMLVKIYPKLGLMEIVDFQNPLTIYHSEEAKYLEKLKKNAKKKLKYLGVKFFDEVRKKST